MAGHFLRLVSVPILFPILIAPGQSHCPKILRIYASRRQLIKQVHGKINRENDAAYQLTTRVSHKFVVTDANILYN